MDDHSFEVEESAPLLPEGQQPDDARLAELEPELARQPSRRKRATQIGLMLAALVAVVAIFRGVIPSASQTPNGQAALQPTTVVPAVLIESNINFGTVIINGQRQRGKLPLLFAALNRAYRITVEAPPFSPETCTVAFDHGALVDNGTCSVGSGNFTAITANGITATPSYSIELDFSAGDLPPDQHNQVNTLLARSVSQQQKTTVPAGSYIATRFNSDATITSQRVTTPVQATASLIASDNFGSQMMGSCSGLICQGGIDPSEMPLLTGNVWAIDVPVALRWRFTTSTGQVVSDVLFPVAGLQTTLLAYSADTGWILSPQSSALPFTIPNALSNLDCLTGTQVMQQLAPTAGVGYGITSGPDIQGCQINLIDQSGAERGTCIWRFGVLLAADDVAHKLLPSLPIAPQAEINAVQA